MSRQRKRLSRRRKNQRPLSRQGLTFENLETRTLLAADFPLMDPLVLDDDLAPEADPVTTAPDGQPAGGQPPAGPPPGGPLPPPPPAIPVVPQYSVDGSNNNLENSEWGSTGQQLLRLTTVEYADGISAPAGADRPSARVISNAVVAQDESVINDRNLTDLTWVWGQFIDHDIDLSNALTDDAGNPLEPFPIEVPTGDVYFDPFATGEVTIDLYRTDYDPATGDSLDNPRAQVNAITAFIDGSVVYGSDDERATELRAFEGGKLKTGDGDLLPFNEAGLDNAGGPSDSLFLAGDVRANENVALTSMQTLWVREHNRWADQIAANNPELSDEQIYQQAKSMVVAELQAITYNEFLPALLGRGAIDAYAGYDPEVNPEIANIFSTAAYRFGHSMLSSELLRLNNDGTTADEGNLSLSSAFFAPGEVVDNGIDSLLLGAASQRAQEIDNQVVDDVRNFLFGPPGAGGFDLASLNIQRGRDHGLADYNQTRVDFGLDPVENFSDITSDPELAAELEALYGDVNNIDVWVGGLAEDHAPGASMGELFRTIIADQFSRIRDGDANWYQHVLDGPMLGQIENTTLSDVIERNTDITELRDNVFFAERDPADPPPPGREQPARPRRGDRQNRLPPSPPPAELAADTTGLEQLEAPVLDNPAPPPVNQPGDQVASVDDVPPPPPTAEPSTPTQPANRSQDRDRGPRPTELAAVDEAFAEIDDVRLDVFNTPQGRGARRG